MGFEPINRRSISRSNFENHIATRRRKAAQSIETCVYLLRHFRIVLVDMTSTSYLDKHFHIWLQKKYFFSVLTIDLGFPHQRY